MSYYIEAEEGAGTTLPAEEILREVSEAVLRSCGVTWDAEISLYLVGEDSIK